MGRKGPADSNQKRKIQEVAGRFFMENGYDETSIRQIAKALDVSPGLIGYYYPSKRDIARELLSGKLAQFTSLSREYVDPDDPMLVCAVTIKLEVTVLSSANFRRFYSGALREDIVLDVLRASGIETYQAVNEKYHLGYTEDELRVYDLIAASTERTLVLYSDELQVERGRVADLIFCTHMGRLYGTEEFLQGKCRESELIVAGILCDHPEILQGWD